MFITDHDLYDISACLTRIRNAPACPANAAVLVQIVNVLSRDEETDTPPFNRVRSALAKIPQLDREQWRFVFHENLYVHFTILKDKRLYDVLIKACTLLQQALQQGNLDKAEDLADCIHCLPDIIAENRLQITKSYWKTHVVPYRRKWDKGFLLTEQKLLDRYYKRRAP